MIPKDLSDRYQGWHWELAYHWTAGYPTYRISRGEQTRFVKVHPVGAGIPDEANRLRWARAFYPVPEVVEYGSDGDFDWLMTLALPGVDATRVKGEAREIVIALAEGLRWFHVAVPPQDCPFWPSEVPDGRVVVCHGDYCLPNVMFIDGRVTGYLDLGALGVGDPQKDIDQLIISLDFNLGPGYADLFVSAYGR